MNKDVRSKVRTIQPSKNIEFSFRSLYSLYGKNTATAVDVGKVTREMADYSEIVHTKDHSYRFCNSFEIMAFKEG